MKISEAESQIMEVFWGVDRALSADDVVAAMNNDRDWSAGAIRTFLTRLLKPADFETRFDAEERTLILAHEHAHRVSGHTIVNALIEIARCTCIAAHPSARRTYAQALLKARAAPGLLRPAAPGQAARASVSGNESRC